MIKFYTISMNDYMQEFILKHYPVWNVDNLCIRTRAATDSSFWYQDSRLLSEKFCHNSFLVRYQILAHHFAVTSCYRNNSQSCLNYSFSTRCRKPVTLSKKRLCGHFIAISCVQFLRMCKH